MYLHLQASVRRTFPVWAQEFDQTQMDYSSAHRLARTTAGKIHPDESIWKGGDCPWGSWKRTEQLPSWMQCQQNQIRCSDISQVLGRRGTTVLGAAPIAGPPFGTYHFVLSGMAREKKKDVLTEIQQI
jgi:hypothetical protein